MKRLIFAAAATLSVVLAVSAAGCGGGMSADGKTFTITKTKIDAKVNDRFVIELESNATTGFQWGISGSLNPSVIKKVRSTYVAGENPDNKMGVGGVERWTFEAVGKGTGTIVMIYRQPFDKEAKPARTVTFTVTVT